MLIVALCITLWLFSANNTFIQSVTKYNYSLYALVALLGSGIVTRQIYQYSNDEALSCIADSILRTYRNIGYCYRIGGDEFAVILRPGMLQTLTSETPKFDAYQMMESLMKKLDNNLTEKGQINTILENGVAQGYGIYFSPIEYPSIDAKKTIDEVIKLADDRMYKNKEMKKEKK